MINSIVSSTVADMKKSAAPFATPLPISQILTAKKETIERISFTPNLFMLFPSKFLICVVEKSDFMKQIDFLRKLRSLKINCKGGELVKYEER